MKKVVLSILCLVLASSLYAQTKTEQSKLAADMRTMLAAVTDIQRAGFYNNKTGVKEAATKLIKSLDSLLTTDPTSYLPNDKADAGKFAKKREQMIKLYTEDLIVSIESENIEDAMDNYSRILNECTSCHSRIRTKAWK
ncbi:MAG: hypothetical protein WBK95_03700 [Sulfurimonas sp.]|jgi:Na+-transporting NADH:ubiquinone oxidoreductase subunit NqrC|nr:hypothetical protein [Sulfurimonas sp.]MDD3060288.1 hypothetical protein [Sulfurimonas sp.]MDD5202824.1 hypothetical protein [Sulfurimonas sp.]